MLLHGWQMVEGILCNSWRTPGKGWVWRVDKKQKHYPENSPGKDALGCFAIRLEASKLSLWGDFHRSFSSNDQANGCNMWEWMVQFYRRAGILKVEHWRNAQRMNTCHVVLPRSYIRFMWLVPEEWCTQCPNRTGWRQTFRFRRRLWYSKQLGELAESFLCDIIVD